jgi:hypothetical protein
MILILIPRRCILTTSILTGCARFREFWMTGQGSSIQVSGGGGTVRFVVQRREAQLGREDEAQIVTVAER